MTRGLQLDSLSVNFSQFYNLYGQIVTKKEKGCSFYYELLNADAKNDGWIQPKIKLEAEMIDFNTEIEYDSNNYMTFLISLS